jgi:NAD(P)H-hydrate epimerase
MHTFPPRLPASWPPSYPLHRPILTSEARALDAAAREGYGAPALLAMERAALGVAVCASLWAPEATAQILVLCGPGDNGGDGYACARQLAGWGRRVRVLDLACAESQSQADARRQAESRSEAARLQRSLAARVLDVERANGGGDVLARALTACDVVIDALFGVGLARPLVGGWLSAIAQVNDARRPVLAVDVPSGLDADTGEPRPLAIVAEVTATMAAPKRGLLAPGAGVRHAGRVVEIDIGLPWALHAPYLARASDAGGPASG